MNFEEHDDEDVYRYEAPDLPASVTGTWGSDWPDQTTLGEAAEEMDFDLFNDDDPGLVLVKALVDVADVAGYSIADLQDNDAEDRFSRLGDGLVCGGKHVPPVVLLGGDLRDGAHRAAIAEAAGLTRIPAYVAAD